MPTKKTKSSKAKLNSKQMDELAERFPILQNKKALKTAGALTGIVIALLLFNNINTVIITITSKDIIVVALFLAAVKFIPAYRSMKSRVELYERMNEAKKKRSKE